MAQYHTRTFAIVKRDVFLPNTSCIVFFEKNPKEGVYSICAGSSNRGAEHPVGRGYQRGRCSLWPEESKETGSFVAGNPTGTVSPWHTTLLAKSSVLYLCEGDGKRTACFAAGTGAQEDGCGLELRSDCSGRQQPAASPEQRDTVTHRCLPIMPDSIIVLRNRSVSQLMPWHHFDITSRHHS